MKHIITKEFAERLKDHLAGAIDEVDEADALFQELLSLPVLKGEPVGIVVYKPKMLRVGALNTAGMALPDGTRLYTHPAPFTPITADMVTDEMLETIFGQEYKDLGHSPHWKQVAVADVVKAFNGISKYMETKK
jgi:hypothetical protein